LGSRFFDPITLRRKQLVTLDSGDKPGPGSAVHRCALPLHPGYETQMGAPFFVKLHPDWRDLTNELSF
jgi:hypothetical protein